MDDNVDASEAHQFVPMDCFDLNELSQEGIIIFYGSLEINRLKVSGVDDLRN